MQAKRRKKYGIRAVRTRTMPRARRAPAAGICGLLFCLVLVGAGAVRGCAAWREPDLSFPLEGGDWWVSSGYGWREDPVAKGWGFHQGVDLACAEGTLVLAAMDGVVSEAYRSTSYGNCIRLAHSDGFETLYAHLQYLYVRPGEVVRAGQVLGSAGQTGQTTGSHLHFELIQDARQQDPTRALGLEEHP